MNTKEKKTVIWPYILLPLVIIFIKVFVPYYIVSGTSMFPTYKNGEIVFIDKGVAYEDLNEGDVIILKKSNSKTLIKRIIAKDKCKIQIIDGYGIVIDGERIEGYDDIISNCEDETYYLKDGEMFVVGDNYNNSSDSRVYGAVTIDDVIGKVITK